MKSTWLLVSFVLLLSCTKSIDKIATTPKDIGQTISHALTKAEGKSKGVVLLFHQAGSNLHEYDPITLMFNKIGYDTIAFDQRSGGTMWGFDNLTAKKYESEQGYSDAYPDLVTALNLAESKGYSRIIAIGSSYSASLVLKLASENSTVSAVIAFSPAMDIDVEGDVAKWNSQVTVPTLFAATKQEVNDGLFDVYETAPRVEGRSSDMLVFFPGGVHGASTLRKDKNPESSEQYCVMVKTFLETHFSD